MRPEQDPIRFRHMLDAAREALGFAGNRTRRDLERDRMFCLAVVKEIEIIGEAASNVSPEGRKALPTVDWASLTGMRNRIVHAYYAINLDIVWKTIVEDLPPLVAELERILTGEEGEGLL